MDLETYLNSNDDIISLSNKVVELENALKSAKELENNLKIVKEQLKDCMQKNGVKTWTTTNGTLITLIPDKDDTIEEQSVINEEKFILENKELVEKYNVKRLEYKELKNVVIKGKKGYLRITLK